MSDREFVSTTGTKHRVGGKWTLDSPEFHFAACSFGVRQYPTDPVIQQPVKDCKRCYPKGRTE